MKKLVFRLVLPLTLISFVTITKWWQIQPVDAPDKFAEGFPLIYSCEAFHTSCATQFFMLEFIFDVAFYFVVWLLLIFLMNRFILTMKLHKVATVLLWLITVLLLVLPLAFARMPENVFKVKRDFDIEVLDSGTNVIWDHMNYARYQKIQPEVTAQPQ